MKTKLYTLLQYILPHRLLSKLVNWIMRIEAKPVKNFIIKKISSIYRVNLDEALSSDLSDYKHFNAFFTRQLKPEARPIDTSDKGIVCPADGVISQCGSMKEGRIFQAKGFDFSVKELLACDDETAGYYKNGDFATIYLSPKDYHRMHSISDCEVTKTVHVPGRLFSVATWTAENIPRLFARNERLVCYMDTEYGKVAYILVGAILVSSMETVFNGLVTPPYGSQVREIETNNNTTLKKGDEVGRFNMGSTVILLFPPNSVKLQQHLKATTPVKMGEKFAEIIK